MLASRGEEKEKTWEFFRGFKRDGISPVMISKARKKCLKRQHVLSVDKTGKKYVVY